MDEKLKKVLSRLEAQCSKREYCSSDMLAKALKALDNDAAAAQEVLGSLLENRFVDDLRYSCAFAREKASIGGWGRLKICMVLRAKRIAQATIDQALEEIDTQKAGDRLDRLIAAKRRSLEGDPYIRLKLIKYALGRGYGYDEVQQAIDRMEGNG